MRTAYSYLRFSTKQQRKGDSTRRQTEGPERYCREHGLTLSQFSLKDMGVSAFRGKNATKGALGKFLEAVESGRIKRGATLIVECLDRLTRQEALEATSLFIRIVSAGIEIVTLFDEHRYSSESVNKNPMELMYAVMVLSRAHEESASKAKRIAAAWANKRKLGKPMTARCPNWIELRDGEYQLLAKKAEVVRRIVDLALEGNGALRISKHLLREKTASLGRGTNRGFGFSTIQYLLRSRALIGELQPKRMVNGRPTPTGDPIKGYYPAVIPEAKFHRLQAILNDRVNFKGRGKDGRNCRNLFCKLLTSAKDGGTMTLTKKAKKQGAMFLMASVRAMRGVESFSTFQYQPFEEAFFTWVRELDLSRPAEDDPRAKVMATRSRLLEIKSNLTKVSAAIAGTSGQKFDSLLTLMQTLEQEMRIEERKLQAAEAKCHDPVVSGDDLKSLIEEMNAAKGEKRFVIRLRLRQAIANVVRSIKVTIRRQGMIALCLTHVILEGRRERLFAVRTERHRQPVTYSDAAIHQGRNIVFQQQWIDRLGDKMLKARDMAGMTEVWCDSLGTAYMSTKPFTQPLKLMKTA